MAIPMVQATWNGEVVAKSDETEVVEGNHYFPHEAVREELLEPSDHTTRRRHTDRASAPGSAAVVEGELAAGEATSIIHSETATDRLYERVGVPGGPTPSASHRA